MFALWTKVTTWMKDEKGASMVEYALLVVLIAMCNWPVRGCRQPSRWSLTGSTRPPR